MMDLLLQIVVAPDTNQTRLDLAQVHIICDVSMGMCNCTCVCVCVCVRACVCVCVYVCVRQVYYIYVHNYACIYDRLVYSGLMIKK